MTTSFQQHNTYDIFLHSNSFNRWWHISNKTYEQTNRLDQTHSVDATSLKQYIQLANTLIQKHSVDGDIIPTIHTASGITMGLQGPQLQGESEHFGSKNILSKKMK